MITSIVFSHKYVVKPVVLCVLAMIWAVPLYANFLCRPPIIRISSVSPGEEIVLNQRRGEEHDYAFMIENTGEKSSVYSIAFLTTEEAGRQLRLDNYTDLPESSWFVTRSTEIVVPAGETGRVRDIAIKIPHSKQHYNKKYQAYAKVTESSGGEGLFRTEVYIPIFIRTVEKHPSIFDRFLGLFRKNR